MDASTLSAPQVPDAGPDALYSRNLGALFRIDARLAQRIDETLDDGSVLVEPSRSGPATAAVRIPDAERPVSLHSRVDPLAEASRLAEAVKVGETFCYLVSGLGLGYHIKALLARLRGDAFLVVAEPNLQVIRKTFEHLDLSEAIAAGKCILLTSLDKGELQTKLEPHNNLMMIGSQFISHPASERLNSEFHSAMRRLLADHLGYVRMCLVTLVANSRLTCRNIACNLPAYVSTPPLDDLRDRFRGRPGIVIAAGPSLRRNIDLLAGLQDRAVLIAVQTVFRMLLDRGIRPDFVTSLDYHEMSRRFFEGIEDFGATRLVAEPKVTWHVTDAYKGRMSLLSNEFARSLVGDDLGARGGLKAGATVAHLAFYLAVYLGCEPIVLVGQDLGYSDHVYYSPGVAFHELWRPDLNRFCTMEMKEWERIARHRRILRKATDIHGQEIYTDDQLFTYLQQFEGDFAAVPGRVIDATEGGLRKAGTRVMTLAQVAEQYCPEPIPAAIKDADRGVTWRDPARLTQARSRVEAGRARIGELAESCRAMAGLLREMEQLIDRPAEFNRRMGEVDTLRLKVRAQEWAYKLVSAVSQHAELQRYTADRQISLAELDSNERARRQLARDIRFVEAILEGCTALDEILAECLGRFDTAIAAGGVPA